MAASLQRRRIDVIFKLGAGTFDNSSGSDTLVLSGLRVSAEIDSYGGSQYDQARVAIWGLTQEHMNRLSFRWYAQQVPNNTIEIRAGTSDADMVTIYRGDIFFAQADYQGAPDVPFRVESTVSTVAQLLQSPARTYRGNVPVSQIMSDLAKALGANLTNNGVTATLTDQNLNGTLMDQVRTVQHAANIDVYYEPPNLIISPKLSPRDTQSIAVNASTGMVGWPTVDVHGVNVTLLYNPTLHRGSVVNIDSSVKNACGKWYIYAMQHRLESELPGGAWFTHVSGSWFPNVNQFQ